MNVGSSEGAYKMLNIPSESGELIYLVHKFKCDH